MASTELEIRDPADLERLLFEGPESEVIEDPIEAQKAILRRIMEAETPEALFQIGGATPWRELIGVPIEVLDVTVRRSRYEQGAAVFAVVRGHRMDDGSAITLTNSGMNVLGTLFKAKAENWLPLYVKLVQGNETAAGYRPLWLENVTPPAVKAS